MGNMRFKVGDRVRIKSLDWYNENKDKRGFICFDYANFIPEMSRYCGEILTINQVVKEHEQYRMSECGCAWTDEMIEGLVGEEIIDIDDFQDDNEIIDIIDEYVHRLKNNECQINLPEGYQFTDENGNVINATKIVLEKKKKEYPKTHEECINELDINEVVAACGWKKEIKALQTLLVCRDAYWKIAGEEMGLGKPWRPDWENFEQEKRCIWVDVGSIILRDGYRCQHILVFPTAEMRDAFYDNFKELIESCKELL